MKTIKFLPAIIFVSLFFMANSCNIIGGIFKTGVGVGIIITVAVIVLILIGLLRIRKGS